LRGQSQVHPQARIGRDEVIVRKDQVEVDHATEENRQRYGPSESLYLSDAGGLTEFGAHVQTLQRGSRSSDRHWHEEGDEFLYVISGEATVVENDGVPGLSGWGDAPFHAGAQAMRTMPYHGFRTLESCY